MKKCVLMVLVVLAMVTGCSRRSVSEKQIKEDLEKTFAENNFSIEDISIDLHSKGGKQNIIELTANMKSDTANITRMYRLVYDYYEVGGWVLNSCDDIHTEQWRAVPSVLMSNDMIADTLFEAEGGGFVGGHVIKSGIQNAHFKGWSRRSAAKQDANYVKKVEYSEKDLENGKVTILAHCKVSSPILEISESFELQYKFNPLTLCWEVVSGQSVDHSHKFLEDISGTYRRSIRKEDYLTFSISGDTIMVSGYCLSSGYYPHIWSFDNEKLGIDGAFVLLQDDLRFVFQSIGEVSFGPSRGLSMGFIKE